MKRHPALQDLSRDHHLALLQARRLRGEDHLVKGDDAVRGFLKFVGDVLGAHFAEEEVVLLPHVRDAGLAERLRREHSELVAKCVGLAAASESERIALGEALRAHIRFEEDILFPAMQASLPVHEWDVIAEAGASFRKEHRKDADACAV